MSTFEYAAQDGQSKVVSGLVQAGNLDEAIHDLQTRGYLILTIAERSGDRAGTGIFGRLFVSAPKDRDLLNFARDLDMLLRGGLPMLRALGIISTKSENPLLNEAVAGVAKSVASGKPLHEALSGQPQAFPPLIAALARVGEESGQLPATMKHFAAYMERRIELRRKVVAAITYPAVVVTFAFGVVLFLCMKVVPTFAKIFSGFKVPIPAATQAVLWTSYALVTYWPAILMALAGAAFVFSSWRMTESGKLSWTRFLLSLPVFGPLFRDAAMEKFFSTLGLLTMSGVSILNALQNLHAVFEDDPLYAAAIDRISMSVAKGRSVSATLRDDPIFPQIAGESLEVAEESGTVTDTLKTLGEFHGEQLDVTSRQLATLLEPFMVALIGGLVGFIMFALFIPMLDLTNIRIR